MKTSIIRTLLIGILAGLVVASAGMASAGHFRFSRASATEKAAAHREPSTPMGDPTTCPSDEGTSEDDGTSRGEATVKECEPPDDDEGTTRPEPGDTAAREAECKEAAGLSTVRDGQSGSEGTVADGTTRGTKTKGLDHAIEVVLANCIKNPQAKGLLNALRHLVENRDRHMARKAEKALRRAAREARKAASHGAKGHGKGNGKVSE